MTTTFSIRAAPSTDIWRKPPRTNVFNAPSALPPATSANSARGPLKTFVSAQVSFSFPWSAQYDQAGLLLSFHKSSSTSPSSPPSDAPQKWLKTGVEFYEGAPQLSTVACDAWADWSVAPLTTFAFDAGGTPATAGAQTWTTILVERAMAAEADGAGPASLWVFQVLAGGEKVPLREVCWVYGDAGEWEVSVAAMAARPAKDVQEELVAEFRDFDVKWEESSQIN